MAVMSESISLQIKRDGSVYIVEEGLTRKEKQISPQSLLKLLHSSLRNKVIEKVSSGPLPANTVFYEHINRESSVEEVVVIQRPACIRSYNHFGESIEVGYPKLLFAFKVCNEQITSSSVAAVKDEIVVNSSMVYHFPYANVFKGGGICWGSYRSPAIKCLTQLSYQPEAFYFIEHTHLNNAAGQKVGELLEKVKGKKFDESLLVPMGTFKDFIKN